MQIWLYVFGLVLGSMAFAGCDDSGGDPPPMSNFDCRNEGYGCGLGFECRQNGASGYECLPAEVGAGGMAGTGGMPDMGGVEMGGQPDEGGQPGMGGAGEGGGGGEESPCDGLEDGEVVVPGERGQCEGIGGPCSQTGIQRWADQVCRGGVLVEENRQGDCEQDTEGRIIIEGMAGECAFADPCVLMGARPRRDTVCREGLAVPEETMLPCERDTAGVVVSEGDFGPCAEFDDLCDLSGLARRVDVVCEAGASTQVDVEQECERAPPGVVFEGETAGACVGPEGAVLALPAGALTIPEGAIIQPTPVWFTRTDEAAPEGYRGLSPVFEIAPADQVLARPVSLSLAFDGDLRRALIFWAADGGSFERAGGQFVDGRMVATSDRFGHAFVGDGVDYAPAPDPTCVRLIQRYGDAQASPAIVAVGFGVEDCRGRPVSALAAEALRVQEDGAPLPAEVTRRLTPPSGLQLFVNLTLDLSDSTAPNLGALILAAKAFVRLLQVERRLPVQIAITTFAGGAEPTVWEAATRDTEHLLLRLDALANHREDAPLTTNLNGAVVHALA